MKAFIYKISSPDHLKNYIGSTIQNPHIRWAGHRYDYKRGHKCTINIIFEEYGTENLIYEIIEEIEYNNRSDYVSRERFHIENTENCVNKHCPFLTENEKEHYISNHYIKNYKGKYIICECGSKITYKNIHSHKRTNLHKSKMKNIESK